jgi:hypothetical protein
MVVLFIAKHCPIKGRQQKMVLLIAYVIKFDENGVLRLLEFFKTGW